MKKNLFLLALVCLSLGSCSIFNEPSSSNQGTDSTTNQTNTDGSQNITEETPIKTDSVEDETKGEEPKVDGDKEEDKQDDKQEDKQVEYYTATFYSYDRKVFKTIKQEKGKRIQLSSVLSENNVPIKPSDNNSIGYVFNWKWKVLNGKLKDQVYTRPSNTSLNDCYLFDIDYDIGLVALYDETTQKGKINFYDQGKKVCSFEGFYGARLCNENEAKSKFGYSKPCGNIESGRLGTFLGWGEDENSKTGLKAYSAIPAITKNEVNYYAHYETVKNTNKAVFAKVYADDTKIYTYSEYLEIAKSTFNVENGVLKSINDSILSENGKYKYEIYLNAQVDNKITPGKIDKTEYVNITSISSSVFKDNKKLCGISLGKITTIGSSCFQNTKLNFFEGGSSLKSIGTSCFEGATLSKFPNLGKVTEIPIRAFYSCTFTSKNVEIGDSILSIKEKAFSFAKADCLVISKSVTNIDSTAFRVFEVGVDTLTSKQNRFLIKEFKVAEDNSVYRSQNGAIIKKEGNVLIVAGRNTASVPSGVQKIIAHAFSCINYLDYTGAGISNLSIPQTVSTIEAYAFLNLNIKNITYAGTYNEFKKIINGDSWGYLVSTTKFTFSDCTKDDWYSI